jgi:hypothetical protein
MMTNRMMTNHPDAVNVASVLSGPLHAPDRTIEKDSEPPRLTRSRPTGETRFPPCQAAERAGFEPATDLSARTRFPVALLRPLGHLSEPEQSTPAGIRRPRGRSPRDLQKAPTSGAFGPLGHLSNHGTPAAIGRLGNLDLDVHSGLLVAGHAAVDVVRAALQVDR